MFEELRASVECRHIRYSSIQAFNPVVHSATSTASQKPLAFPFCLPEASGENWVPAIRPSIIWMSALVMPEKVTEHYRKGGRGRLNLSSVCPIAQMCRLEILRSSLTKSVFNESWHCKASSVLFLAVSIIHWICSPGVILGQVIHLRRWNASHIHKAMMLVASHSTTRWICCVTLDVSLLQE